MLANLRRSWTAYYHIECDPGQSAPMRQAAKIKRLQIQDELALRTAMLEDLAILIQEVEAGNV